MLASRDSHRRGNDDTVVALIAARERASSAPRLRFNKLAWAATLGPITEIEVPRSPHVRRTRAPVLLPSPGSGVGLDFGRYGDDLRLHVVDGSGHLLGVARTARFSAIANMS